MKSELGKERLVVFKGIRPRADGFLLYATPWILDDSAQLVEFCTKFKMRVSCTSEALVWWQDEFWEC